MPSLKTPRFAAPLLAIMMLGACDTAGSERGAAAAPSAADVLDPTDRGDADTEDSADLVQADLPSEDTTVDADEEFDICAAGPATEGECLAFCSWGNPASGQKDGETRDGCAHPDDVAEVDGLGFVPDEDTFEGLGAPSEVEFFGLFDDPWYVNIAIDNISAEEPWLYFIRRSTHGPHWSFFRAIGCAFDYGPERIPGAVFRYPEDGTWAYAFDVGSWTDSLSFTTIERIYELLLRGMPALEGRLSYVPLDSDQRAAVEVERELYEAADFPLLEIEEVEPDSIYRAMNPGVAIGRLRTVEAGEFPTPQDIAIYATLPNTLPRTAGIVTTVPQTPLSHVNLRATQDRVPNAFIRGPVDALPFAELIGEWVFYEVTEGHYTLRRASDEEVAAYNASFQPVEPQRPRLDLGVTEIAPLDAIGFADRDAFGMKAAAVAELRSIGLPASVPDGFAIPFFFYDEFMAFNGLDVRVEALLGSADFRQSVAHRERTLGELRDDIRAAAMPDWMTDALSDVQSSFDPGQPIRCRSSSNAEDLEGFSGAGLYNSYTHHPEEGHLSKSVRQVFASLWTLRAVEAREFHGIQHDSVAMGVLMHPNYSDERVNGVAVSNEVLFGTFGAFYVNSQVGEDLVTNPEEGEFPEEMVILGTTGDYYVVRPSSLVDPNELLLRDDQISALAQSLRAIHDRFADLYQVGPDDPFAMEIEFKITAEDELAIKQARPWVFESSAQRVWTEEACACRCEAEE